MPIRGELRPLYPPNWKELSHRVRFERARGRCEVCGRPHVHLIRCLPDGRWFDPVQQTWRDCRGRRARWPDLLALIPARTTRIVLATAHLDHDPTNNRLRNLKSLCQRCHMIHDAPYHRAQRWITHRRRYAAGDLFLGFYRPPDAGDTAAADPPQKEPRLASPIEVMRAWPRDGRQAENPRQWRLPQHPHDKETWTLRAGGCPGTEADRHWDSGLAMLPLDGELFRAGGERAMTAKLNSLFDALRSGEAVRGSTSEMCAVGLAAGREDVLPAPYITIADAWRRLNDEQRLWVEEKNPKLAAEAAMAAIHFGTVAWH